MKAGRPVPAGSAYPQLPLMMTRRISSNASIKLAADLAGRGLSFGLTIWAARQLGPEIFGHYAYGLAVGFVIAQLADFGLQLHLAREIAADPGHAAAWVYRSLALKVRLTGLAALVLLVVVGLSPAELRPATLALGSANILLSYGDFFSYVFRGQQQLLGEAVLILIDNGILVVTSGLLLLAGWGLAGLVTGYWLSAVGTALAGYLLVRRRLGTHPGPSVSLVPGQHSALLPSIAPIGLAIFLSIGYTRLPVFLLQTLQGAAAVGVYSAAQRVAEPLQILPAALLSAVFPALSHSVRRQEGQARRLERRTGWLLLAGGLLIGLGVFGVAPWLVAILYPGGFQESAQVLRWLGLATIPAFVNYGLTHFLIARGRQRWNPIFVACMLLSSVGLGLAWIPAQGPAGAALAVAGSELLLTGLCIAVLRREGRPG